MTHPAWQGLDPNRGFFRRNVLPTAIAALVLLALAMFFFGPLIGLVFWSPVLGFAASYLLVVRGVIRLNWLRRWVWRHEHGNFHAFDDMAVCIEWRDEAPQVLAADLFRRLAWQPDATFHRRLSQRLGAGYRQDAQGRWWFSDSGALDWLYQRSTSGDPAQRAQAQRLRLWLEREVFPPLRRRHAG